MKNIGLLGDISKLDSLISQIKSIENVLILGKVSDGISSKLEQMHFTIPEKNKVVLLEECDIFIVENPVLFNFNQIIQSIKKGKSIFFLNYPNFTIKQCEEIVKLSYEAQSSVYISNPFLNLPSIKKAQKELTSPFYIDMNYIDENFAIDRETILPFVLFANSLIDTPKRIDGVTIFYENAINFINIRFSYSNSSSINLKMTNTFSSKFELTLYSQEGFKKINISKELKKSSKKHDEVTLFLKDMNQQKVIHHSIENYVSALIILDIINEKLSIDL